MEIQINILNEMKKLRTSTYADKYTWVDELMQNAQRAGASNVHVDIDWIDKKITIEDNGCGCTDPQVLFRKSDTGWDQVVVNTESPFGEGFFSTMMAANKIEVESIGFKALFDVQKMFDTGDIDCIETTSSRRKSGFKVVLYDLTSDCHLSRTVDRFKETAKYIKKPATYIDGTKVPYEGLNPQEKNKYMVKLNNDMFSGWLIPYSWKNGQWGDCFLKAFAYDRYVKDLPHHDIVRGVINLKPDAVVLRSPDRHDIIQDEKYDRLIELVEDGIKSVMVKILKYGSDKTIKNFEYEITKYLTPEECKKYIKFKFVDDKVKPDDFVSVAFDDDDCGSDCGDDDCSVCVGTDDDSTYDNNFDPTLSGPTMSHVDPAPPQAADDAFMEPVTQKKTREMPQSEQTGQTLDGVKYAFYVMESETTLYKSTIELAQKYKVPVIVVRNNIELQCIEKTTQDIMPIYKLGDCISLVGTFTNSHPIDAFEQRIYNLLNGISARLMDVPDLFVITDTRIHKVLEIGATAREIEEIKSMATAYNGKIYINRKYIKTYGVSLDNNDVLLNDMDKRFILLNLEVIANELAIVKFGTTPDTRQHYEGMIEIIRKIIYMLYD